jgi:hypothetical protein
LQGGEKSTHLYNSVADPGCLSEIPDLNFFHPGFQVKNIPDPGSGYASKNFSIFNLKNCSLDLENMIRDVHPGSGSCFFSIPDPGSRVIKTPDPGSETLSVAV